MNIDGPYSIQFDIINNYIGAPVDTIVGKTDYGANIITTCDGLFIIEETGIRKYLSINIDYFMILTTAHWEFVNMSGGDRFSMDDWKNRLLSIDQNIFCDNSFWNDIIVLLEEDLRMQ